ncbi:toxin-antitoxin system YwqK family antitoxin [Acinetobacter wuhouensis]|uniref:MORN repeat variant n=1 Tax=Acinetobacter wuhouensis TaxID=1879050 RepID=A0A4Q7AN19_9GAMM|nr:hypothetical protein [Acinetobacter wuhouensis]RZG48733.1 hypothetical protein EXU28_02875 [Acinetobacter wuhouensis]RZG72957.1 hypothetical protein EXU29_08515 [Acinetobacter wuhouensis]
MTENLELVIEYYETGEMKLSYYINTNKQKHGECKFWHKNGKIFWDSQFVKGQMHGLSKEWSPTGNLLTSAEYVNGKLHGHYQQWQNNGLLLADGFYKNGLGQPGFKWYKRNGELWSISTIEDIIKKYKDNGEKKDFIFDLKNFNADIYCLPMETIKSANDLGNLYISCQLAIERKDYTNAINLLSLLIDKSLSEDNDWFLATAFLLRAYSFAKNGKKVEALYDLENTYIDKDSRAKGVFWLKNHECINQNSINLIINQYLV